MEGQPKDSRFGGSLPNTDPLGRKDKRRVRYRKRGKGTEKRERGTQRGGSMERRKEGGEKGILK